MEENKQENMSDELKEWLLSDVVKTREEDMDLVSFSGVDADNNPIEACGYFVKSNIDDEFQQTDEVIKKR